MRIRKCEKKLLAATVTQLSTKAISKHHYYGFAGNMYLQKSRGPIELRGTFTIATIVMQNDKRWEELVRKTGLKLKLYIKSMDDGRAFLHPAKIGRRWKDGTMTYSMK